MPLSRSSENVGIGRRQKAKQKREAESGLTATWIYTVLHSKSKILLLRHNTSQRKKIAQAVTVSISKITHMSLGRKF